jgi:hypothetical protein
MLQNLFHNFLLDNFLCRYDRCSQTSNHLAELDFLLSAVFMMNRRISSSRLDETNCMTTMFYSLFARSGSAAESLSPSRGRRKRSSSSARQTRPSPPEFRNSGTPRSLRHSPARRLVKAVAPESIDVPHRQSGWIPAKYQVPVRPR